MSTLLIPIAPLSRSKSRLNDYFTKNQLRNFTLSMFKDLGSKLSNVHCYENILVYNCDKEILEISNEFGLTSITEDFKRNDKSFDNSLKELNDIAIKNYNSEQTTIIFLDLILISKRNLVEINTLLNKNQLVICPSINSMGISILGRNPPSIIPTSFSDPYIPSLLAIYKKIKKIRLKKVSIYDSFRAGFDIDIKEDLVLAYEYLKIFNLTNTNTFKFLRKNLKLSIIKQDINNNRKLRLVRE
ncbi:MAG: hypothetical protein KGD57_10495 [Candidatus Lokiarchaeota archaeon]|nr:hypothetical protein [Candidatus Lokiarchaeota archaeon]